MIKRRVHKVLLLLRKYPLLVGATLTYGGLLAATHGLWMVGFDSSSRSYLLIFMICMTPMTMYADYIRAVPKTCITLAGWFWTAICCGVWSLATWLDLENSIPAMSSDHSHWRSAVALLGLYVSIYLSRVALSSIKRQKWGVLKSATD